MVHCEFSLLLQVHEKIQRLMECLKISFEQNQASPSQDGIVSAIISDLDRSLSLLLARGEGEGGEYDGIEQELQRQEQLNRNFIRRELEFKEYQKCVLDQLAEEKKMVKGLQSELIKANSRALAKDLEILQMNQTKSITITKETKKKDLFAAQTILADIKLGDPFKSLKDSTFSLHRRGKSDELVVRSSTTTMKKKVSVAKK